MLVVRNDIPSLFQVAENRRIANPLSDSTYTANAQKSVENVTRFAPLRPYSVNFSITNRLQICCVFLFRPIESLPGALCSRRRELAIPLRERQEKSVPASDSERQDWHRSKRHRIRCAERFEAFDLKRADSQTGFGWLLVGPCLGLGP